MGSKQLHLIPLEEIERSEQSGNPNREKLGKGPADTFCRNCANVKDRGSGKRWFYGGFTQTAHKWRCAAMEGSRREKALKLSWPSCIYWKEKKGNV